MQEIIKPNVTTYYIIKDNEKKVVAYGQVEPSQSMSTGQPILDTFIDELEWIEALKKDGIIIGN